MQALSPVTPSYRGRFAPTPSGPLHMGSLLTALAGWLQARKNAGKWLLRIDDLDVQRCVPGATDTILEQLEGHGLHWDETPRYQSQHVDDYAETLQILSRKATVYACSCTRAELRRRAVTGLDGPIYDGHCRELQRAQPHVALRLRLPAGAIALTDARLAHEIFDLQRDLGDFVLRRSDGVIGYPMACIVDEQRQQITEVVRGHDLLASSLRQVWLMNCMGWRQPSYLHLPVIGGADGRKLSKQNHAAAIEPRHAADNLFRCLEWLGQNPPRALRGDTVDAVLEWATASWDLARIPLHKHLQVEGVA